MGLDVGVIPSPIKYLDRAEKDVYDFVWYLNLHADDGNWNVYSDGNTIIEYERENMERQMGEYIDANDLTQQAIERLMASRGTMTALCYTSAGSEVSVL